MDPLLILLIGVIVVIALVLFLKVNAFIALISAAMLISLLAPGEFADKISRVAASFGGVVQAIGIVIALAAVIGKCMMESGAADKIVRSFLKVLGEKRAATALMGSGFVLSIPVFFDTVFYLLIPLARSLCRRTQKNYILYVTAIVAGAAVSHSLIPPTPGPLFMANSFNVDLGVMILVGILIGLPAAGLTLVLCRYLDRILNVPMRPYGSEPEPEPLADDKLPPLWLALLPIVLPILLIAANTVSKTLAEAEHPALLTAEQIQDWSGFHETLSGAAGSQEELVQALFEQLPSETQQLVQQFDAASLETEQKIGVVNELNLLLASAKLFAADALGDLALPEAATAVSSKGLDEASGKEVERFNRLVMESIFPDHIQPHVLETPRMKTAKVTAVLGNPNFALLISTIIAMVMLVRNRGISLKELSKTTETALMSGGVIILITAAGGAFGGMLRAAGIQDSITDMVGGGGQGGDVAGILLLLSAFGVAVVVKFAQGSGTVSMITTAAIFGSMGISSDQLGCNLVYLAMAIGNGSMVGDWMNNSGFWIFAKMSVLTEAETLKSWTIVTAMLGIFGLILTLIYSRLLPFV